MIENVDSLSLSRLFGRTREDRKLLPGCTSEGCNYVIECLTCRREGRRRRYYGETSRSPHQRGNEHQRDIAQGVATHPLVAHFVEEHNGITQEILMRVISRHMTPLDRQVSESMNILRAAKCPEECLNLKSEWGGSKLPDLQIFNPKGISRKGSIGPQEIGTQGEKRIFKRDEEIEGTGQPRSKRGRSTSPGNLNTEWMERPTFRSARKRERSWLMPRRIPGNQLGRE